MVIEQGIAGGNRAILHVIRLSHSDVILFGEGRHVAVGVGDGQGDIEGARAVISDACWVLDI